MFEKLITKYFELYYKKKTRGNSRSFSLIGKKKICKVLDVLDGQRCIVVFDIRGKTYKWCLRMDDYRTPITSDLLKLKNNEIKTELSKKALEAQDYFGQLIAINKSMIFHLVITGFDKRGHLLGKLYYPKHSTKNGISLNELMVINGYAIEANNISNPYLHE